MKHLLSFILLVGFFSCKPTQSTESFPFLDEEGTVLYLNFDKEDLPIVYVTPAVFKSIISDTDIERLAKKNRVVVAYFISQDDRMRTIQVDAVQRRLDYYSDVLSQVVQRYGQVDVILAEGLNASIANKISANFKIERQVMINPWIPTIKSKLVEQCYSQQSNRCDSLLKYVEISTTDDLSSLLLDIESGVDNLYGNYAMRMWRETLDYEYNLSETQLEIQTKFIYTSNTGLIEKQKADAKPHVYLYTLKEFQKLKDLLSN